MVDMKPTADAPPNIAVGDKSIAPLLFDPAPGPNASRDDLRRFYNFFLRREPESEDVQAARSGLPIADLVADFLQAEEFQRRVCACLASNLEGPREYVFGRPRLDLIAWATSRLGLRPQTASEISGARTWAQVDLALLRDEIVWEALAPSLKEEVSLTFSERLRGLERGDHRFDFAGCLDVATPDLIAGWCCDRGDLQNKPSVEIYVDDELVATVSTSVFRTDLLGVIGGDGRFGFHFSPPTAVRALFRGDRKVVAREASSRRHLGELLCQKMDFAQAASNAPALLRESQRLSSAGGWKQTASPNFRYGPVSAPMTNIETSALLASGYSGDLDLSTQVEEISRSGLFDSLYYENANRGSIPADVSPLQHYIAVGEALGLRPNPYFYPNWYSQKYRAYSSPSGGLLHYIRQGERDGNKPCPFFEPAWYLDTYLPGRQNESPLNHYLSERHKNLNSPNEYFDIQRYMKANPDLAQLEIDGFWHWITYGIFEGRKASDKFNADFVWRQYLGNNRQLNAFEIFMDVGLEFGWEATPGDARTTLHRQVAANVAPGPLFETLGPKIEISADDPKVIALYLPQFHAIPENDEWWGTGFTEWRNLARGLPRFEGHIQPRVPRDLGFYALENTDILRRQVDLARHSGIYGFCFYYYNFNGRRLLERPLEGFLADTEINFPFCIMWANENWSRRWDGSEHEILIRQDYLAEDLGPLIDDVARHMKDPRYLRSADGRPLFFVYRADIIKDGAATIAAWRERFRSEHALDPLIIMSQTFGAEDPRPLGFDGAIEIPPHKLASKLPRLNPSLRTLDPAFGGVVRDYAGVVQESLDASSPPFALIKTACPSWDNDARQPGQGMVIAHSTPAAFQNWMHHLLNNAVSNTFHGLSLVFINAWNEWCEGAYLEPDTHFGFAYLNAVGRALQTRRTNGDFADIHRLTHPPLLTEERSRSLDSASSFSDQTSEEESEYVVVAPAPNKMDFSGEPYDVMRRMFDVEYYLRSNPDVARDGYDPFMHFAEHGWKEGRSPNRWFDSKFYLGAYEDIRKARINPFLHFIIAGRKEGRQARHPGHRHGVDIAFDYWRPSGSIAIPVIRNKMEYSPKTLNNGASMETQRILVHIHAYYENVIPDLLNAVRNIHERFDIVVTSPKSELYEKMAVAIRDARLTYLREWKWIHCENRGRDIAPWIIDVLPVADKYDIGLHIHTKNSQEKGELGARWRRDLVEKVLYDPVYVTGLLKHFSESAVGLVYPTPYSEIEHQLTWGQNRSLAQDLVSKIMGPQASLKTSVPDFPAGMMFWYRPSAVASLTKLDLTYADFPAEPIRDDGTLAHALERIVGTVVKSAGYEILKVRPALAERSSLRAVAPVISVIIPARNAARWVSDCIESVRDQVAETPTYEIIVVENNSTDNTPQVLRRFADLPNIRLISADCRGAGGARNAGMALAEGRYIMFVDADDLIVRDALSTLYTEAEAQKASVTVSQLRMFYPDSVMDRAMPEAAAPFQRVINNNDLFVKGANYGVGLEVENTMRCLLNDFGPCAKLYLRKFLMQRDIRFDEGVNFEDNLFIYKVYASADTICMAPKLTYLYRKPQHNKANSTQSTTKSHDAFKDQMGALNSVLTQVVNKMSNETWRRIAVEAVNGKFTDTLNGYPDWVASSTLREQVVALAGTIQRLQAQ